MADKKKSVTAKTKTKTTLAEKAVAKKTADKQAASEKAVGARKASAPKMVTGKKAPITPSGPATRAALATKARPTTSRSTPVPEPKAASSVSEGLGVRATVSAEQRATMIQEAAYYKAEKRNFAPGFESRDWDEAEREVDERLGNS